jgi:cell division protein ZapA (FtsZ GTPase activity inhibitor)
LEEDFQVMGFGTTEVEALVVVVPSLTSSPELFQLEQEIKALENSAEYQILAFKNHVTAIPKPTEKEEYEWQTLKEEYEWQTLKEKLDSLKRNQEFYRTIQSMNAQSLKQTDKTRKRYKKDTAIKDERLLLSDVAITL